jgi:CheY-like chemotaxis protein
MSEPVRLIHPPGRPLCVLVVDDNRDGADSLADLLTVVGCEAHACYNGGDALQLAEEFRPDAFVLDLMMPGMDGLTLARHLRVWADGRPLLLIAYSGFGGPEVEQECLGAGFDHHITKPGDSNEIFREFAAFTRKVEDAILQLT